MRKRLFALLLALVLGIGLAAPALAAEDEAVLRTVKALGIMVGDEYGNMNLDRGVTRAQFAKMLVAASKYRDSVSPDGTGYSLYRDVKNDHWASEYIRIAAQEGWMTGYTDSTFRPENTITLEEVCASTLRLLGYSGADLAGSFPYAHLSKASALGLRDGLDAVRGQAMTRLDCARLIYNLFSAQTAAGQVYGSTVGLTVRDGEVDYLSVLMDRLSGPYVASAGTALSFTPVTIFRDGAPSAFANLNAGDVYYYNEGLRSVWIYTKRVSGKIDAITSSGGAPAAVTVAGKSYTVGSTDAAYQLSALSGTAVGSYVTLLLGMEDKVAGVLSGAAVNDTYYGVVQSVSKAAAEDKAAVQTLLSVFCTDGETRSFILTRDADYVPGNVVAVSVSGAGAEARIAGAANVTGRVSADGRRIGSETLAEDVRIIDAAADGSAVTVPASRLAGMMLEYGDVRFCTRSAAGEIDRMILNDLTGDTWSYALLTRMEDHSMGVLQLAASYTYILDGKTVNLNTSGVRYAVEPGGIAIRYETGGGIKSMRQLTELRLTGLEGAVAFTEQGSCPIAEKVQVYLRQNGSYYLTELGAVNAWDYVLTGWYNDFAGLAGRQVRVIVAQAK